MIYYLRIAYLLGWIIIFPLIIFFVIVDFPLSGLILPSLSYIRYGEWRDYWFLIPNSIKDWYCSLESKIKEE